MIPHGAWSDKDPWKRLGESPDLEDSKSFSHDGFDFTIFSTNSRDNKYEVKDENGEEIVVDHRLGVFRRNRVKQDMISSVDRNQEMGFEDAWLSTLPRYKIFIWELPDYPDLGPIAGNATTQRVGLSAPYYASTSRTARHKTVHHEYFHTVQWSYLLEGNFEHSNHSFEGSWSWVLEGSTDAVIMRGFEDFRDKADQHRTTYYANPAVDLLEDEPYVVSLFWNYMAEQYGSTPGSLEDGLDFIRGFWEELAETADSTRYNAGLVGLRRYLRTMSGWDGRDVYELFTDFSIAYMLSPSMFNGAPHEPVYEIDRPEARPRGIIPYLPEEFVDQQLTGLFSAPISPFSAQYYILRLPDGYTTSGSATAMGLVGGSTRHAAFLWFAVAPDGSLIAFRKHVPHRTGRHDVADTWVMPAGIEIEAIYCLVVGLAERSSARFGLGVGPLEINLEQPTTQAPALAGPPDQPWPIIAQLRVDGPNDLRWKNYARNSVAGINKDRFRCLIGGEEAEVLTVDYVGDSYQLLIQPPIVASEGPQTLEVQLRDLSAVSTDAVLYQENRFHRVFALDVSGSMGDYGKSLAAQQAAKLFLAAMLEEDRFALVTFNGNETEPDDDAYNWTFNSTGEHMVEATPDNVADTEGFIDGLPSQGHTSIGDGLLKSQQALKNTDNLVNYEHAKSILLITDGHENEANFWRTGSPSAWQFLANGEIRVDTIGIGGAADTNLLQDIAAETGGGFSFVGVPAIGAATAPAVATSEENIVLSGAAGVELGSLNTRLQAATMAHFERSSRLTRMAYTTANLDPRQTAAFEFDLPADELNRGISYLVWDEAGAELNLELLDHEGQPVDPAPLITEGDNFLVWKWEDPLAQGDYTAVITHNGNEPVELFYGLSGEPSNRLNITLEVSPVPLQGYPPQGQERFQQGLPVDITASLTDQGGPITGADVELAIVMPDGTLVCGPNRLTDEGNLYEGAPDDGVYGARFFRTNQASRPNANYQDAEPLGVRGLNGTYYVHALVSGRDNNGRSFTVLRDTSFEVFKRDPNDLDQDELPDLYEHYYTDILDYAADDAALDSDFDGLTALEEFQAGTVPDLADTDGGGEADGSEIAAGRCPLDPLDDVLQQPLDFSIHRPSRSCLPLTNPGEITLLLPSYPGVNAFKIYRSQTEDDVLAPGNLLATVDLARLDAGAWRDSTVGLGNRYYYAVKGVSVDGAESAPSILRSAVATERPAWPMGDFRVNNGAQMTDSPTVNVEYLTTPDVVEYRVKQGEPFDGEPYQNLITAEEIELDVQPGDTGLIYVQYRSNFGEEVPVKLKLIRYDPDGDLDNDSIPNGEDADDDGDNISDEAELNGSTDPTLPDSDGDGYEDGEELDFGSDPNDSTSRPLEDEDADGFPDDFEAAAQSDPEDPNSHPHPHHHFCEMSGCNGSEHGIIMETVPGAMHQLQSINSLGEPNLWIDTGDAWLGDGSTLEIPVPRDEQSEFFRTEIWWPLPEEATAD